MNKNEQRIDNQPEYEAFGCQYNGCINPTTPDSRDYCDQHIFPEERNPIITGDSDTDELLEDERIAQEELNELAEEELDDIDYKRFTGLNSDASSCAKEYFLNQRAEELEDRIVQQQINMMRGK